MQILSLSNPTPVHHGGVGAANVAPGSVVVALSCSALAGNATRPGNWTGRMSRQPLLFRRSQGLAGHGRSAAWSRGTPTAMRRLRVRGPYEVRSLNSRATPTATKRLVAKNCAAGTAAASGLPERTVLAFCAAMLAALVLQPCWVLVHIVLSRALRARLVAENGLRAPP